MKIPSTNKEHAFTLLEALVVATVLLLLLAMLLPGQTGSHRKYKKIQCVNNLKQMGAATRVWEGDHHDKYPWDVLAGLGGAADIMATGNAVAGFQVMSNELANPKLLICPADHHHKVAANFQSLTRSHISYFISLEAEEADPQSIMAGDDSLLQNGSPVPAGILNLGTNNLSWSKDRHDGTGNLLIADGSVQATSSKSLAAYLTTNSVVIP